MAKARRGPWRDGRTQASLGWLLPLILLTLASELTFARAEEKGCDQPKVMPAADNDPETINLTLYEVPPPPRPQVLPPPRRVKKPKARPQYELEMEMPTPEQLFRTESETTFRERIRREGQRRNIKVRFPADTLPTALVPLPRFRHWPSRSAEYVPSVVCYRPLYFEDKNSERYGWHVPLMQPLISTGKFYFQALLLPYHLAVQPPWACHCNSGYPLPGDPVPYMIYLQTWDHTLHLKGNSLDADLAFQGPSISP